MTIMFEYVSLCVYVCVCMYGVRACLCVRVRVCAYAGVWLCNIVYAYMSTEVL